MSVTFNVDMRQSTSPVSIVGARHGLGGLAPKHVA